MVSVRVTLTASRVHHHHHHHHRRRLSHVHGIHSCHEVIPYKRHSPNSCQCGAESVVVQAGLCVCGTSLWCGVSLEQAVLYGTPTLTANQPSSRTPSQARGSVSNYYQPRRTALRQCDPRYTDYTTGSSPQGLAGLRTLPDKFVCETTKLEDI